MKTTVGKLRKLIQEDMFNYTGKDAKSVAPGNEGKWKKVRANVNMLKATVEKLEHAMLDDDEHLVSQLLDRAKQFTKLAEKSLYGLN
jgi:hypothetical protein